MIPLFVISLRHFKVKTNIAALLDENFMLLGYDSSHMIPYYTIQWSVISKLKQT